MAGITEWQITNASEVFKTTNFESAAEASGVIAEEKIGSNIADYKARLTGWYDNDTTNSDVNFPIGTVLTIDYLYAKTSTWGFHNITSIVSSFIRGPKLREAQSFTLELEISGLLGVPRSS